MTRPITFFEALFKLFKDKKVFIISLSSRGVGKALVAMPKKKFFCGFPNGYKKEHQSRYTVNYRYFNNVFYLKKVLSVLAYHAQVRTQGGGRKHIFTIMVPFVFRFLPFPSFTPSLFLPIILFLFFSLLF